MESNSGAGTQRPSTDLTSRLTIGLKDIDAPKGTIAVSDAVPTESFILAYRSIDALGAMIAERIVKELERRAIAPREAVVVLSSARRPEDLTSLGYFSGLKEALLRDAETILGRIDALTKDGARPLADASGMVLPAVGAALTSAFQVAALFRVDESFKYGKVDVVDEALTASVAGRLAEKGVRYRDQITLALLPAEEGGVGVMEAFGDLHRVRRELDAAQAVVSALPKENRAGQLAAAALAQVVASFDATFDLLTKPNASTGSTRLADMVDAERFKALLGSKGFIVSLKSIGAAGGSRTRTGLLWSSVRFSGGAVVSYSLYGGDGELVQAATLNRYTGFRPSRHDVDASPRPAPNEYVVRWLRRSLLRMVRWLDKLR